MGDTTPEQLAAAVLAGERAAVAQALSLVEDRRVTARAPAHELLDRLAQAQTPARGHLVGLTGPPGVGKSSLAGALIRAWRAAGRRVGVLAVDPSSPRSGGALLGDRLRMLQERRDDGLFIRSLAGRGELGGLSAAAYPMSQVLLAAYDIVLVETIGIGQTEIDVVAHTDTVCLLAQPVSGDLVQVLKAGILELPALVAVNKADLGGVARRAASELRLGLSRARPDGWDVPVLLVSATLGTGIPELVAAFAAHRAWLEQAGRLPERRAEQAIAWGLKRLALEFGQHGVALLGGRSAIVRSWQGMDGSAFSKLERLRRCALERFHDPSRSNLLAKGEER